MIVVDASAGVLGLINDGDAREFLATEPLACPHLADSEVVHSVRSLVMRGEIDVTPARDAINAWSGLGIQRFGVIGTLERVWELRENLSAYDATYVALAEALDCALLTADARLARAPGPVCPVTVVRA